MPKQVKTDDPLPEHLQRRPDRVSDWPLPTAWLLGTKLLGSLRDIILSSIVRVDLRNWMTAGEVIDRSKDEQKDENGDRCCYIDFLADTGDSQRLVYQLARLLTQPKLEVKAWQQSTETSITLPRGTMLVLGGDIAYPIATHRRLLERIRAPFRWAHDELVDAEQAKLEEHPVTLLAVPGNHDYYDGLRGFEAMFHAPAIDHPEQPPAVTPPAEQPLRLPGYKLAQHASYFAAALPFGWRLWGIDVENAEIDDRQAAFFEWTKTWKPKTGQQEQATDAQGTAIPPPDSLIVVTSRPAFVYQGRSDHADVIEKSMNRLGLTPAFANNGELPATKVRLDLSGDVHLYERYWGTDHAFMPDDLDRIESLSSQERLKLGSYDPPERYAQGVETKAKRRGNDKRAPEQVPACKNYASVVSGLGGTFHHPSQVRMGKTPPRAAWPSAESSAREIGIRLADPAQMFRAGAVGIVGLAVSLACYFLIWETRTSVDHVNVLDVPFAISSYLSSDQVAALCALGRVAAMVGVVIAMIALPVGAYFWGRWLSKPIRDMREPTCTWSIIAKAITHEGPLRWVLRLAGANSRSAWMFLSNIGPIVGTLVGWWYLGGYARRLEASVTELVAVYSIITVVVLAMAALGLFRAGAKTKLHGWFINIVRRVLFLIFGALIACLVIWTPYAWVRLICRNHLVGAIGGVVMLLTMLIHIGVLIFPRRLWSRRLMTALGFLALAGCAVAFPLCFAHMDGTPVVNAHPAISLTLAAVLGAYFASLWVGWYFCICLQWNAHGNEAGGAARVTKYGEFLRIKLTENAAEVWAIAVEEDADEPFEKPPTARLIDHFTVARSSTKQPDQAAG